MSTARVLLISVAIAGLGLGGCTALFGVEGSGTPKTEQRQVAPFERVEASGAVDVSIRSAPEASCQVSGDDNIVPLVITESVGSTLSIRTEKQIRPKTPLVVTLTTPKLSAVELSGACDADIGGVRGKRLDVRLSGAGEIDLTDVHLDHLEINISGAGEAAASGSARSLSFGVSGAGDGKLGALCTREAAVRVSGAGGAEVAVAASLSADISGAGSVQYLGDPAVNREVSGAGSVTRLGPLPVRCTAVAAPPADLNPAD
jgi:hypothetical protein